MPVNKCTQPQQPQYHQPSLFEFEAEPVSSATQDIPIPAPADYYIHFHALCEPAQAGTAVYAWIAFDQAGNELGEDSGYLGSGTGWNGHTAAYHALIAALHNVVERGWQNVALLTCNALVAGQVQGDWQCNSPALLPLYQQTRTMRVLLGAEVRATPKGKNVAVELAYRALDQVRSRGVA